MKTKDWRFRVGDCIYDYATNNEPAIRKGVHNEGKRQRVVSGQNALPSDHFYYFGVEARLLPAELKGLIKRNQGQKKIEIDNLIHEFENWMKQFERNKLYSDPYMRWLFDRELSDKEVSCWAMEKLENDEIVETVFCKTYPQPLTSL